MIAKISDLAAIGTATAAKCQDFGLKCEYVPEQADSGGLLQLPRLQNVAGQQILIVRGRGGREQLADTLRARGAQVDYAEVYERRPADVPLGPEQAQVDVIMLTSTESLMHLATLARQTRQDWVFSKQLVLIHARIAGRTSELGFTLKPLVAKQASDRGMIDALLEWCRSERRQSQ